MADSADAAAAPGTPRAGTPEPSAPEPEAEPAAAAEPAAGGGDALTAEDIVRWWGHVDREAGEACPHYGRHFCHYLDHEITSLEDFRSLDCESRHVSENLVKSVS